MLSSAFIIPAIISLAAMVAFFLLFGKKKEGADIVSERVQKLAFERKIEDDEGAERSGLIDFADKVLNALKIDPFKFEDEVRIKFAQAGIESREAIILYVFAKKVGPFVGGLLFLILATGEEEGMMKIIVLLIGAIFLLVGFRGADMFLRNRKEKRQYILQRSFPDALDLILVCVEAGLALDAALSRVCKELDNAHPEITKELNKTRMELTLLNDRAKALQNLAERTDMVAFRSLVAALLQSEKFGTSLTETLRVLSEDYRHTRMMVAENKANRLPALMTIPLMLLMMPAFIMILMGPAIIMLVDAWGGGVTN